MTGPYKTALLQTGPWSKKGWGPLIYRMCPGIFVSLLIVAATTTCSQKHGTK